MSVDSRYIRVATKFWQDEKVRTLSDDAKMLYLYVLTSPHSNMAGYYILPKPYVAYDLKWLPERLDKAFNELLHQGVIKYCETSDVVLIPNFFKYNPLQNKNQAIGAARRVAELPTNTLTKDFLTVLKRFAEPFLEHFAEWFGNTDTDTDTDTESASECACAREEKDDDEKRKLAREITDAFTETFAYPPNLTQMQMLVSFLDDGLTPWHITEALKRSAEAGARSPNYAKAILQDWVNKKAFSEDDVKKLDAVRTPKKRGGTQVFDADYEYEQREQIDPEKFFDWADDNTGGGNSEPDYSDVPF